jgi:hypothetical protein
MWKSLAYLATSKRALVALVGLAAYIATRLGLDAKPEDVEAIATAIVAVSSVLVVSITSTDCAATITKSDRDHKGRPLA